MSPNIILISGYGVEVGVGVWVAINLKFSVCTNFGFGFGVGVIVDTGNGIDVALGDDVGFKTGDLEGRIFFSGVIDKSSFEESGFF